jgi:hypothetical protein
VNRLRRLQADLVVPVVVLAVIVGVVAVALSVPRLHTLDQNAIGHLTLFVVAIALGETARLTVLTDRDTAPMSTAAALALSLSTIANEGHEPIGSALIIATIGIGMAAGGLLLHAAGDTPRWPDAAARLLGVAVAPLLYRTADFGGQSLIERLGTWVDNRWAVAVVMVLIGTAAMVVDLSLEGLVSAGRAHAPLLPTIIDEVRSSAALASALVTSGALIALAEYAIGLAALPLFLLPLLLTYFAVQRFAGVRETYRQTIAALSSLTDRTGYTVPDHAQRVSRTAVAIGRDLGMGQRELTDLEYAAMLHDLGQVALREPIPAGATVAVSPADQQRIAHDGAEIVRTTGVLDGVAEILEAQTTPFRQAREFGQDIPLSSRIIKVVNAFDDIAGPSQAAGATAMERLHLGLGYEYDPDVVDSLTRVLERRQRAAVTGA